MEHKTIAWIHRNDKDIAIFLKEAEALSYDNIADIEVYPAHKWISVKDKLPAEHEDVVLATDGESIYLGYMLRIPNKNHAAYELIILPIDDSYGYEKATHWMSLPELPKPPKE